MLVLSQESGNGILGLLQGTLRDYHRDPFPRSLLRTREIIGKTTSPPCNTAFAGQLRAAASSSEAATTWTTSSFGRRGLSSFFLTPPVSLGQLAFGGSEFKLLLCKEPWGIGDLFLLGLGVSRFGCVFLIFSVFGLEGFGARGVGKGVRGS